MKHIHPRSRIYFRFHLMEIKQVMQYFHTFTLSFMDIYRFETE